MLKLHRISGSSIRARVDEGDNEGDALLWLPPSSRIIGWLMPPLADKATTFSAQGRSQLAARRSVDLEV